ncbi:GerAB/ArcD/ProY family transporter [Shouchella clausii]|uniref:Uncharacterized protein n=1 Tax=Shouchella clausii TaxID=79880 RepID=A0A268S1S3_SHOCL|nr:GerAB/ArcD/ProY family transporter [Shouchella clausii]PAD44019.1 hypothetical protein CHH54_04085 [Bacillus sp. 7520-S]MEB5478113.1 GerAB/ArcD/ProY family transporter [Shouchella clausii]PAD08215.1 hypothetical protein CHH76_15890 [Shouchella clausii]PAD14852.1 hypothetical protein CHH74_07750 [Shouchella clausii]PAE78658.1 hypothetical protein CHH78_19770 [Shouchella clausii]
MNRILAKTNVYTQRTLTNVQFGAVLMTALLGVGVLNLPRTMTVNMNTADGWISVIIAGVAVSLIFLFNVFAFKSHHVDSIDVYMERAFGKWVSNFLCIVIATYFLVQSSWQVVAMSEMIRYFLLEETPYYVVIGMIVILSAYAVFYPFATVVRICCFFLPISLIVLLLILGLSAEEVDMYRLRPIAPEGFWPIFANVKEALQAFQGAEIMLLILAFLRTGTKPKKSGVLAFSTITVIYMLIYGIVVSSLGVAEVKTLVWPTIALTQAAESGAFFSGRLNSLLISTWTLQFFTTIVIALFATVHLLDKRLPIRRGYLLLVCAILVFAIGILPQTFYQITMIGNWEQYAFLTIFAVLPFLCYLTVAIKKKVKA